jgi:hypothetical protein
MLSGKAATFMRLGQRICSLCLPENIRELEEEFWRRVDAAIVEALRRRRVRPSKKRR